MKTIENLIDEYLPRDCIVDLSEFSFMDSSGNASVLRKQTNEGHGWQGMG